AGRSDEVVLEGERACGGSRRDAELGEDVLHMTGDRVLADHQRRRDLLVALARGHQSENLQLTRRQTVSLAAQDRSGQRVDRGDIGSSPELLERPARRIELE